MTTITALNVRLGMDVSNFSEGANLAKGEVTKVASIMRQSVPPAERYKKEVDLLNRAFSEAGKKSKEYADAVDHLKRKHEAAAPAIRATANASKEAGSAAASAIGSIKGMAAAYLSVQTISKSITLANELEDATIAFEVLTGSAKDGALILEQIRKFDKETPITFSGLTQAAKTMMSFGVEAKEVEKNLRMISDVTGGNNERFKMLSLAFSQMSAAGRLMGQDLLQMVNAGFNPLQQISKTTGESLLELKERMGEGRISAEEIRKAFEDATAEGGMFHGMTERLAETVSGQMNIALSDMEKKLAEMGQAMGPMIVQLLDLFTQLQPVLIATVSLIERISLGIGVVIAALSDGLATLNNFSNLDFTEVTTATDKFFENLEKRERKAAEAAGQQIQHKFEQKMNGVDEVKMAEMRAAREAEAARLKAIEEEQKAAEKAAKKAANDHLANIEKERKARLKAIADWNKAQAKAAKKAEEAFEKELEDARKDAMKFFEDKKKAHDELRKGVAKGPGAGMELGSAEQIKFVADTVNGWIAKEAVPEDPIPTQRQIAAKTVELWAAQMRSNEMQANQLELARKMLDELRDNGFRRLR